MSIPITIINTCIHDLLLEHAQNYDDSFWNDPRHEIDFEKVRYRISKFEYVVRTHRFSVCTLLLHLCDINRASFLCQIMNTILHTWTFKIYALITKSINQIISLILLIKSSFLILKWKIKWLEERVAWLDMKLL